MIYNVFNEAFLETVKMIGLLWITVMGYILSGTATHCLTGKREQFNVITFFTGIGKAIVACVSLILIAYILTIIDLSSLGFDSNTIINAGILVYAGKIIKNSMYLLGITKDGKESNETGSIIHTMEEEVHDDVKEEETVVEEEPVAEVADSSTTDVVEEAVAEENVEEEVIVENLESEYTDEEDFVHSMEEDSEIEIPGDFDSNSSDSEEAVG